MQFKQRIMKQIISFIYCLNCIRHGRNATYELGLTSTIYKMFGAIEAICWYLQKIKSTNFNLSLPALVNRPTIRVIEVKCLTIKGRSSLTSIFENIQRYSFFRRIRNWAPSTVNTTGFVFQRRSHLEGKWANDSKIVFVAVNLQQGVPY